MWLCGLIAISAGAALLIGIFTPIVSIIAALGMIGLGFSILSAPMPNLMDEKVSALLAAVIAAAVVLLGPGAYSVDAHLFGRREIIIPPRAKS